MKILKTMKNESLLCFCATRFTAVAALQAYILHSPVIPVIPVIPIPGIIAIRQRQFP